MKAIVIIIIFCRPYITVWLTVAERCGVESTEKVVLNNLPHNIKFPKMMKL